MYNRFMKKIISAAAAISAILIVLSGCKKEIGFSSEQYDFYTMDTTASLVISEKFTAEKRKAADGLAGEISSTLLKINSSLSATDENSYISRFNNAAAGAKVEIDEVCYEVLSTAIDVYNLTGGCYNPAVYYSVYEYGFHGLYQFTTAETLPSAEKIQKYQQLSSRFGEVELSQEDGKFYALKPQAAVEIDGVTYPMKIDLGGIGKGYAVDKVNALMDKYGFENGYFNFGSSSIALKKHYINGNYTLGLSNPRAEYFGQTYFSTSVEDLSLSTSGDYEQYYEIEGVRYCHIIDPATGEPVQTGIMSATVIGGTAAEDDALTTALMCMGKEGAVKFINEKLDGRYVVFAYKNGANYEIITNIPAGEFTVTDERYTVVSALEEGKIVLGGGNVT